MISDYDFSTPLGWKCPCCGHVFSPTTPECPYCSNAERTVTSAGTMPKYKQIDWSEYLKQLTNIEDYSDYEKWLLNPSNATDSDTFQVHFDKATVYKE